ncbi:MAG: PrgI family protein [bacterium]|nr:PrgI family protein [bacterium]
MRSFSVPQFIDIEPKIIGPITVKQFIMLLVAAGCIFITYKLLVLKFFIPVALIIAIIAALFAFYKPNGRAFHLFLMSVFEGLSKPAVRTWQPIASAPLNVKITGDETFEASPPQKRISGSKIDELALIVDTGGAYRGEGG